MIFNILIEKITSLIENKSLNLLKQNSFDLSSQYKNQDFTLTKEQKLAYLITRMPATFSALEKVFLELKEQESKIKTVLDLGSGPGTTAWSLFSSFPNIQEITLVEKDEEFIELTKSLIQGSLDKNKIIFQNQKLQDVKIFDYDLIVLSYVVNELDKKDIDTFIAQFISSKAKHLVVVEPGTKIGFNNVRLIRQKLIDNNMYITSPCPHQKPCPMGKDDWCHFYARVQRSKAHKFLKAGSLGYEDEKFSYVIASKEQTSPYSSRVLKKPLVTKGFINLSLCKDGEIQEETIPRKDNKKYKSARKLCWGDRF